MPKMPKPKSKPKSKPKTKLKTKAKLKTKSNLKLKLGSKPKPKSNPKAKTKIKAKLKTKAKSKTSKLLGAARQTLYLETKGLKALDKSLEGKFGKTFTKAVMALNYVAGRVIVTGMGKSGHIANKIAATFASTGTPAQYVHPAEASHGDLGMITKKDIVLCLSWSGETKELANLISYTKQFSIPLIAITANSTSSLAKASDISLILPKAKEACPIGLAPTTSTTLQMVLGDALAVALLQQKGLTFSDFKNFHPGGSLGAYLTMVKDIMHKGNSLPLAKENCLMSNAILHISQKGFGCLGLTNQKGELTGIITDGDLRRHMGKTLLEKKAKDIMTKKPKTIPATMLASKALAFMTESKIQATFICKAKKPLGFVHLHDLLRLGKKDNA